ncbi:acyl--CoA ligase [Salinirubellus salinus]|uniref:Acyl--CoA ligase n=1 Tax=Salinirubellus salinus TaxID=1364945 RepID=A0A9E7R4R9_9EURY|nr:class I adenylate-forming enzyme family protein [Salinirubellus salinus]UWM55851.1 acyl--CoA ligase [Salinirubellus salinus]
MNLYEQFVAEARAHPDRVAITDPDGEDLRYATLDRQARAVHDYLAGRTEPGDRVALFMMDNPTFVASALGAWRAGCVLTLVNYRFGVEEVAFVLDDIRPEVVLTDTVFEGSAREASADVGSVESVVVAHTDSFLTEAFGDPDDAPDPVVRFDGDPAIVMHTSGTTGMPKGVVQSHRNVAAQVEAGVSVFGVTSEDVGIASVPLFHVGGFHGLTLMGLTTGGTICVQPAWDAEQWARLVEETGATLSGLVPAMMVDALNTEAAREYDTSSLRLHFYGGSPTPEPVVEGFQDTFGVERMLDYYGQTEVCGLAVTYPPGEERVPGAMGRTLPCLAGRVVDIATGEELPPGEEGELLLRGDSVMQGYWERPDRNDETFSEAEDGGPRWLHTDDVVVRGEDGLLRYVDRVDDIIHSGGEKVAPATVENVLQELDAVESVAVFGTPDDRLGETVTAAIVRADESLTEADVEAHCDSSGALAGYEKPRRIVFVDEFPRTGSQKIDKVALSERVLDELEVSD